MLNKPCGEDQAGAGTQKNRCSDNPSLSTALQKISSRNYVDHGHVYIFQRHCVAGIFNVTYPKLVK